MSWSGLFFFISFFVDLLFVLSLYPLLSHCHFLLPVPPQLACLTSASLALITALSFSPPAPHPLVSLVSILACVVPSLFIGLPAFVRISPLLLCLFARLCVFPVFLICSLWFSTSCSVFVLLLWYFPLPAFLLPVFVYYHFLVCASVF